MMVTSGYRRSSVNCKHRRHVTILDDDANTGRHARRREIHLVQKEKKRTEGNISFPGESLRARRGEVGTRDGTDRETERNSCGDGSSGKEGSSTKARVHLGNARTYRAFLRARESKYQDEKGTS